MKASASRTCRGSSRARTRTTMLVSAARMRLSDVLAYALVHLLDGARSRGPIRKQRLVHLVGGVAPHPAHHALVAFLAHLDDGTGSETEPPTGLRRNRDLPLSRQPGPRQSHVAYITMVMGPTPVQTHEVPPFRRAVILVADGVGCGRAADAAGYGDADRKSVV